jgi:hypothetical protein
MIRNGTCEDCGCAEHECECPEFAARARAVRSTSEMLVLGQEVLFARATWVAADAQRTAELLRTREAWERADGAWASLVLLAQRSARTQLAHDSELAWTAARAEVARCWTGSYHY